MKKRFMLRLAGTAALLCSLLCGCILAACGGGEKATLTLGTNNGGTLSETSFEVSVGADLSDFLKGKEPTSIKQGLTFAGWYHGEEQIENGATMPAEGLSLTAKYWANYTLKVYTPQEEGGYEETSTTGKAFYGEAFDALSHVEIPEHFTLDESKGTYATGSLSADAVFEVYLAVETFDIRYQANAPDGVSVSGGVFYDEVPFGTKAEAKENPFELPENYRFAGWATTADGAIAYHPGDEIELTGNITLFARWERGLSDIFGGNDLLFVSLEESGVLYLHRTGYEEKLGSFDGETLLFSFETEDGAIVLDGKLNLENNCFFYFRDSMMGRYSDRDGTRAVLEIKEHGAAEYTSADGTRIAGSYGIDLDTGYFEFLSDEDGFLFDLFENLETGEVIFRRQDLGEEGYYYDEKADIVLYLDGLSGLEYHYNEENYEYTVGGEPVLTVYGYYEWNEESNLFMAYTRDYASILKQFTFKVDEETVPAHPDFEIKCAAEMDDGFRGAYTEKWGAVSGTLSLDGYGHGVMDDVEGDYYVITWLYAYEDDNGDMVDDYLLIRFVAESGDITYFRLDTEYGEFELDHTVQKEDVRDDIPYGRYDIEQLYLLNITFNGFLYIFENGATEIWTEYALLNTNEWAYVLYNDLISSVDPLGEGKYVFHGTNNPTTGEPYGNEFVFTVDESTHTAEAVIAETHDTAVVTTIGGTALVVDYTLGEAYLGEGDARVSVDFWCTMGYIDFYTFEYRGAELLYWTEHNERDFHAMQASSMYDVEFPIGDGMEHYSARLFLLDGGTAYLAYELESGMHRFVAKGVYEATDNADEYTFALTDYLSDWEADDFSDYNRFTFKTFAGEEGGTGVFVQKAERLVFENLTTDGYGAYTFTDGDDTTYEGEIVTLIGEEPGLLIYFAYTQNGRTEYIVLSVAPDGDHVVRLTQDAGFWYEMNANRGISADRYLILNGQGKAYFYEVSELENETHIDVGTYVRTGAYANDFLEYAITVDGITTNYLLGTYEYEDTNLPLYQAQIAHRIGEFDVIGGGHVSSKGYPNEIATYIDAEGNSYFGNMYIGSVNTGVYSHSFVNNASGRSVRFWVYENWIATSTEFIFDIAANGKLEARTLPYGDYAAMRNGAADTTYVLRLDGRGSATVMRNGAQADMGVYGYDAETDGYLFVGADRFRFRLSTENVNGETTYIWYLYDDAKFTLYSESDWTMLTLDGFGGAKCVDRYGGLLTGTYDLFADSLGYFEAGGTSAVFSYDSEKGVFSFLDHSAYLAAYYAEDLGSVVFGEAKLSVQGVEYYYTVEAQTVTRYHCATHAVDTIPLPSGEVYKLSGTTYHRYDGGALTFTDDEFGETIALTFRPDGATFTADATFAGYTAGYTITVAYANGKTTVTLTYASGEMDSIPETYAVTLHFYGGENTFTVVPGGSEGVYTDSEDSANTLTIDGQRVGEFQAADALTVNLGGIADTAGVPLSYEGKFTDAKVDPKKNDFNFGYGKVIAFAGSDGIVYTLRFFLDEEEKEFVLISVTVENTFETGGETVTVLQLWKSGREFAGVAQKAIVGVSLASESDVAQNIFNAPVDNGEKVVLVQEFMDTITGTYTYHAFLFDITYGENGFVSALADGGELDYGEAYAGIRYKIRFVYTMEDGVFHVCYLLTFTEGDSLVEATFRENGDGSWQVITEKNVYTVRITWHGGEFTLEITPN